MFQKQSHCILLCETDLLSADWHAHVALYPFMNRYKQHIWILYPEVDKRTTTEQGPMFVMVLLFSSVLTFLEGFHMNMCSSFHPSWYTVRAVPRADVIYKWWGLLLYEYRWRNCNQCITSFLIVSRWIEIEMMSCLIMKTYFEQANPPPPPPPPPHFEYIVLRHSGGGYYLAAPE